MLIFVAFAILAILVQMELKAYLKVSVEEGHAHAHEHEEGEGEASPIHREDEGIKDHGEMPLGQNLLVNYGFEVATLMEIYAWEATGEDPGTSCRPDPEIKRSGFYSARAAADSRSRGVDVCWSHQLRITPSDHDVRLEGYVKTRDLKGSAFCRVVGSIGEGEDSILITWENKDIYSGTVDWSPFELKVYLPPETTTVKVMVGLYGEGQAWFDDLSLVAQEPDHNPAALDSNLLQNPSFAAGLEGWHFFSVTGAPKISWGVKPAGLDKGNVLWMRSEHSTLPENYSGFYQVRNNLQIPSGEVVFSGWIKTVGLEGEAWLNLNFYGRDMKVIVDSSQALSGNNGWQKIEVSYDIPENATSLWARVIFYGKGEVYFDDLDLRILPK